MAATEGAAKDDEEDFLSLEPVGNKTEKETKSIDAFDGEDFISLMPSGDGNEEETNINNNRDGASRKDNPIEKTNQQRSRNFDKRNGLPPWMDTYVDHRRVNPLVALHNEIVGFCRLMEPRDDEMKTREELVAKFTALAKSVFPDCKVEVFGSQATG